MLVVRIVRIRMYPLWDKFLQGNFSSFLGRNWKRFVNLQISCRLFFRLISAAPDLFANLTFRLKSFVFLQIALFAAQVSHEWNAKVKTLKSQNIPLLPSLKPVKSQLKDKPTIFLNFLLKQMFTRIMSSTVYL